MCTFTSMEQTTASTARALSWLKCRRISSRKLSKPVKLLSDYTIDLLLLQGVWEAMHLTALLRHCTREGLADLAAQQATARLRRLQHMPADKAFFEAGGDPSIYGYIMLLEALLLFFLHCSASSSSS